jgi:GT2 family glycosyltransferase
LLDKDFCQIENDARDTWPAARFLLNTIIIPNLIEALTSGVNVSTPLVSVIVPTYNRAYCLARTLDSVLAQTHPRFEIIVIDDGSTDETKTLVSNSYGHDARIKYFRQENQGVTAARNQGLVRAQGDYIALLDSDDVWLPWKLRLQLACFRLCGEVGMVWTDMQAVNPTGEIVSNAYLRTMYHAYRWWTMAGLFPESHPLPDQDLPAELAGTRVHVGNIFSQMVMGNLVHTSTVMLSRARLEKIQGFNEDLRVSGEDYDFHLRTCREGPVGFVEVASIHYQIGMPDCLSGRVYWAHAALNCLATVLRVLRHERSHVRLPRTMIRARLAEIHQWVGGALLEGGQQARARKHLLESLRHQRPQPRTLALLARASLPTALGDLLQRCWRRLKTVAQGQVAS